MATSSQNQPKSQPENQPGNRPELSVIRLDYPQSVSIKDLRLKLEIGGYDPEYLIEEPIPPDPQRPLSPFALRFGISSDPFWRLYHPDGRAHSSLAPEFPNANGLPEGPLPKPSYAELGRLFSAERYQSWYLNSGPKTWQLPVMNEMLSFGGHIDGLNPPYFIDQYSQWKAFREQFVRPDPDRWLSCFKADHWFDLRSNILNSLRDPTPDILETNTDKAWWSRDNKALAYYIETALEIATRVLRQLCSEQNEWLDALLFSTPILCGRDPRYRYRYDLGPRALEKICRLRPRPRDQRATADQLWLKLEELTKGSAYFGFIDEGVLDAIHGSTQHTVYDYMDAFIALNVDGLRVLFEMDSTVNERCIVLFFCVITILHELTHAVWFCRFDPTEWIYEPYYDDEWLSELGHSFENVIFGGTMHARPGQRVQQGRIIGRFGHLTTIDWPSRCMSGLIGSENMERNGRRSAMGEVRDCYLVPTLWVSAMLCEKFWSEVVALRGSVAFRPPRIISSQMTALEFDATYQMIVTSSRLHKQPNYSVPELEPKCKRLLSRWESNKLDMSLRRSGWYNEEYASWQLLPWSEPDIIERFNKFIYHHASRNLYECHKLEQALVELGEVKAQLREQSPKLYSFPLILALLMPWSEPSIQTLPAQRWPLAWPSSAAVEWFNENTDANEVAVLLAEPNPAPQEYEQVFTAAFLGSQKELLDEIKKYIQIFEHYQGGPASWINAVSQFYRQVQMQREANPDPNTWANFTFTIPPYEPGWTSTTEFGRGSIAIADQAIYVNYDSWHDLARGASLFISPPSSPPPSTSGPDTSGPSSGGPVVATRGAMAQRRPAIPARRPYPRYFYISHVANHRSLDNAWVVEPDGGSGFNVFRITNLLKELGATEDDYRAVVITGPQGPTLRRGNQRAEVIRTRLNAIDPIGKLILLRRAEEVAECNGRNGQPAWVSVGPQIYDISNFPLQTSDIALGLPQSSGGPVPTAIIQSNTRADELLRRLNPYLCAYLDVPQTVRNMQYFTPRKLRWHDNPDIGIYIAVNNVVFDITSYFRFHPGGNQLLLQYTGRDATQAFQEYHDLSIMKFYENMQVGYLVPEIGIKDMNANHVAVHEWVYDISTLENTDRNLYETLRNYCGVDTTADLTRGDAGAHALVTLTMEWKSLIVAGLAQTSLPDFPTGELRNYNNHRTTRGAFVVVNGFVYNTTHLMRYPDLYERALGPNWAGREITVSGLAQWLATNFDARRIARLVDGPAWKTPDLNVDPYKAYLARTAPPKYRT